jgi:hypothetical protein
LTESRSCLEGLASMPVSQPASWKTLRAAGTPDTTGSPGRDQPGRDPAVRGLHPTQAALRAKAAECGMRQVLVGCDGAKVPASQLGPQAPLRRSLNHREPEANVNLRIQSPSSTLLTRVDARAADLVSIASYVYAADQSVSRGGEADVHGDDWKRQFTLYTPEVNLGSGMESPSPNLWVKSWPSYLMTPGTSTSPRLYQSRAS